MRLKHFTMLVLGLTMAPSLAYAGEAAFPSTVSDYIGLGTGALTLVTAAVLLAIALLLERAASGSVLADNISWVVAACLCLAASVLAQWTSLFLEAGSLGASQARLGADLLTLAGLGLMCIYFGRVRAQLLRYSRAAAGLIKAAGTGAATGGSNDA